MNEIENGMVAMAREPVEPPYRTDDELAEAASPEQIFDAFYRFIESRSDDLCDVFDDAIERDIPAVIPRWMIESWEISKANQLRDLYDGGELVI